MDELKQRILAVTRQAHLASLATITKDGKPWVRYVIPRADQDLTLRVATRSGSRKVAQLANNPQVHLNCGVTDPRHIDTFLQIQGRAVFTTDQAERHSFWDPHLANVFDGPDDSEYGVIIIKPYRIELWREGQRQPQVWEA